MAETNKKHSSPGRKLLFITGGLLLLLLALYFIGTSSAFIKGVILPRVSKSVGADITASEISLSPFSRLELKNLKVKPPGTEPILTADGIVARYSLMDIIKGNINVHEVTLISPLIKIVEDAEGRSNLDPLLKQEKTSGQPAPSKTGKTPALNVKNVSLRNATVLKLKQHKDGNEERIEIQNVNLSLDQLKNGAPGKLELAAAIRMEAATNALSASLTGKFDFDLAQNLLPENVKGSSQFTVHNATGSFAALPKLGADLTCDLSPTEIRNLALQITQGGKSLGAIHVKGPFDASKLEGKLNANVSSIDKQLLNVLGAAQGIDFGSTKINADNLIELSQAGQKIAVAGEVKMDSLSLTRTNQSTPTLDLNVKYSFTLDQSASNAVINAFTIHGQQNKQPLLRGALSRPMKLDFGQAASGVDESAFELTVTDLNLADWKAFMPDLNPSGTVGLKLNVLSQTAGKKIKFNVTSEMANLGAKLGTNQVEKIDLHLSTAGEVRDLEALDLEKLNLDVAQAGQQAATVSASGRYAINTGDADLKTALEATLPAVFQFLASPAISSTSGSFKFTGQVKQQGQTQTVTGDAALSQFTGRYGEYQFDDFSGDFDLNVEKQADVLQLKKMVATFRQADQAGGSIEVGGNFDTKNQKGKFDLQLNQLNQHLLRPVLEPGLSGKKLISVLIDGNASATLNSSNNMAFKADIALTNLVVKEPKAAKPEAPLSARLLADASMANQRFDLRQVKIGLSPTERAKNEIELKGQIDLSQTNAMQGKLALMAEAIDITPFYDLYSAKSETTNGAATASTPSSTTPARTKNEEPEALKLPIKEFALDIAIGKFFLREIAITDLQAGGKIANNRMTLHPMQFAFNGAPVKANVDLNLGVKGYAYDLSLSADRIPLEPIANSFMPDKRGQYQGEILAQAQVKGAGITGVNLKKNLTGNATATFTNANIQIVGPKLRAVLSPIALALRIQDILKSPLNWVDCQLNLGNGNIDLKKVEVVSEAFQADLNGRIPIADVFTNSPFNNLPVNFSLRRSIAEKASLLPANTPTNAAYAPLPNFVKLKGTLGAPETDINKVVLTTLAARSVLGGTAGKALQTPGNILEGVGNILGGQKPVTGTNATNRATTTNAVPPVVEDILNIFKKKK